MQEVSLTNKSEHDVCSFDLLVEGRAIDPVYQVVSVSVTKQINRIPFAIISLRDGEAAKRDFEISSKNDFVPGKKITIKVGRDGKNAQVFKGLIVRHAIRIRNNGQSELQLQCYDEAIRMTIGRHSRYFENIKDNEVIDELVRKYSGLSTDVKVTNIKHRQLVQHHVSDWDFMLLRAEANGMLVDVNDSLIRILKPDTSGQPQLQVTYGSSVIELEAEMDARSQWKKVQATAWDFSNQQLFKSDTSSSLISGLGNLTGEELAKVTAPGEYELRHSGNLNDGELQEWVNATMMRSRLGKIRGRVKTVGVTGIRPAELIEIEGVGERFSGKAFITSVRHDLADGSWDTHIQFGLDPEIHALAYDDVGDADAAGLISAIKGLQVGKVVALEGDPDGQDRLLVRIPVIDNQARGIWMRLSSLDAGDDRGACFRPEIDDEVIVGFINQDPRNGIILGMVHSSAKPAPIPGSDTNNEKGFTTRSKMHISFNDDTKTITIDTPAGNKIVLDESSTSLKIEDQNNNSITMDPTGIKIKSQQNIDLTAGMALSLKAGTTLAIGGTSVSMKADGNVSMEGAMAKLSGQGITEITGGIVKIN
ncbi:MAG: type VI secretion system tip protein VgrG [Chitinophagaceae bacterium]